MFVGTCGARGEREEGRRGTGGGGGLAMKTSVGVVGEMKGEESTCATWMGLGGGICADKWWEGGREGGRDSDRAGS